MFKKRKRVLLHVLVGLCLGFVLPGCSILGIARRAPMIQVVDDAVAVPPGTDLGPIIQQAAMACKWMMSSVAPGVVRCSLSGVGWSLQIEVRYSGNTFSIEHVGSEGLFYDSATHRIHPGYNKRVTLLRQRIFKEASQYVPAVRAVAAPAVPGASVAVVAAPAVKPYRVESFVREAGGGFSYRFEIALTDAGAADLALSRRIQADLRESVRSEYMAAVGSVVDKTSLRIEFPEYALAGGKVRGRAVVLTMTLLEFVYDQATQQGRLAVKVDPQQYEATRSWVRNNIATLARDKNVSVFQSLSIVPKFTIGREVLRDDGVLEVEFHTGGGVK